MRRSSVQHVNCRDDIAAAKRELLSASEHLKSDAPDARALRPPVPVCWSAAGWSSGGQHQEGVNDTGGKVMSACLHFAAPSITTVCWSLPPP